MSDEHKPKGSDDPGSAPPSLDSPAGESGAVDRPTGDRGRGGRGRRGPRRTPTESPAGVDAQTPPTESADAPAERKPKPEGGGGGGARHPKPAAREGRGKQRREKKSGGAPGRAAPTGPPKHREPKRHHDVRTKDGRLIDVEDDPDTARALAAAAAAAEDAKLDLAQLKEMPIGDLASVAKDLEIPGALNMKKQELVFQILRAQAEKLGLIFSEGVLEILPEGFGFLRAPE